MEFTRMKTTTNKLLVVAALILLALAAHMYAQDNKKVVAVLDPIAIYIVPAEEGDEVGRAFYGELQYEIKKTRRFALVTENQDRNCVILHSTVRVMCGTTQHTYTSGYAAAIAVTTKQGPDLRVNMNNTTGASMREVAHLSAKKIFYILTGEELEDKEEDK
jgi:hypothetical protein